MRLIMDVKNLVQRTSPAERIEYGLPKKSLSVCLSVCLSLDNDKNPLQETGNIRNNILTFFNL